MREPDADNLSGVLQYLEEFNDRFWLLGGDRPFMQVYDLHTAKGGYEACKPLALGFRE